MAEHSLAAYQRQESPLTLQQGLDEYYQRNKGLIQTNSYSEVSQLFQRHDIIHVLFGCSTSLHDETLADTWTIFGSTVKITEYLSYLKYSETTDLLKEIKLLTVIGEALRAIPDVLRVIGRSRKMAKKWNWENYAAYLDQPLSQLRAEYGIEILVSEG